MAWTADQVFDEICILLEPFNPESVKLTPTTDLAADLNMDSVSAMNLVMEIEDRFEIDVPISLLSDVNCPQNLVDIVLSQLNKS